MQLPWTVRSSKKDRNHLRPSSGNAAPSDEKIPSSRESSEELNVSPRKLIDYTKERRCEGSFDSKPRFIKPNLKCTPEGEKDLHERRALSCSPVLPKSILHMDSLHSLTDNEDDSTVEFFLKVPSRNERRCKFDRSRNSSNITAELNRHGQSLQELRERFSRTRSKSFLRAASMSSSKSDGSDTTFPENKSFNDFKPTDQQAFLSVLSRYPSDPGFCAEPDLMPPSFNRKDSSDSIISHSRRRRRKSCIIKNTINAISRENSLISLNNKRKELGIHTIDVPNSSFGSPRGRSLHADTSFTDDEFDL